MKTPRGYKPRKQGVTQIAIRFPDDLFVNIRDRARAEKRPFSDVVGELCKVGIFDLDESDALEPRP